MANPADAPKFDVRYETGGDLPILVDHLYATTIESGIYLSMATLLPAKVEGREASVQATLFLPVSAIEALHTLTSEVRRHMGGGDPEMKGEVVTLRHDLPRSDVPALANFFNCNGTPDGLILSVGRQSAGTPNLAVIFATYHMSMRTLLQLHWLVESLVGMIQRPKGYAEGPATRQ
ncbi:hypothetical protein [Methylobacterium sp. 092160098-2]|uniref:hypothetical protein n=1 Tax=Methylobacterium sp. 092160098-2 TaxID=3025129 RepID=UPI002381CB2F|nr:hypothetical protein [Methylobacterium sp. 092160098-2]MDE4914002.1 hypothetical protein [Methylobacterium sp. 092160098-2]